jgi:hypothetical protein
MGLFLFHNNVCLPLVLLTVTVKCCFFRILQLLEEQMAFYIDLMHNELKSATFLLYMFT